MGSVYRCHSVLASDVHAAVKVLTPSSLRDIQQRFVQEMRTLSGLNHPAIVRVLGGGRDEDRGLLYMAMELIDGEDLQDRLARGPLGADEVRSVFAPVAEALQYAHERGVAHRDIKPGNIMLRADGSPVIVDFGIAVVSGQTRHTREGMVPGTMVYLPPEAFEGTVPEPQSTDAYALGVVMWEALTGAGAFDTQPGSSEGQQLASVMGQKLRAEALDPGHTFPADLRKAVLLTTDPEPDSRLTDLSLVRELLTGQAGDVAVPRRKKRRNKARRRWVLPTVLGLATAGVLGILLAAGGVVGIVAAVMLAGGAEPPPRTPIPLDRSLAAAAEALQANRLDEARLHASHAVDDHPEDPNANLVYGQVLLQEGRLLLARPYLCAAVEGGLSAQVPGHSAGALDCTRGPGASSPLSAPVVIAELDLSSAVANAQALADDRTRSDDAVADMEASEGAMDEGAEEQMTPRPPPPARTRSAPPAAPALEPSSGAAPPLAEALSEAPAEAVAVDEEAADDLDIGGLASGGSGPGAEVGGASSSGSGYGSSSGAKAKRAPAPVPVNTVAIGTIAVRGELDKAIVVRVLRQHLARARACYATALESDPSLSGTVRIKIDIRTDGTVSGVKVIRDEVGGPVASCITSMARKMRFPADYGGATVAEWELVFGR